jgi:hypothetical protein
MEKKILQFPQHAETSNDPSMDRALFFLDCEIAELTLVIPQAQQAEVKCRY